MAWMRAGGFGDDVDSRPDGFEKKGRDVRVGDEHSFDKREPPHENSFMLGFIGLGLAACAVALWLLVLRPPEEVPVVSAVTPC